MSYVILFQSEKGKRRYPCDGETYDTKELAEQQLNDYVKKMIKSEERDLEYAIRTSKERIKNVPKKFTIKETLEQEAVRCPECNSINLKEEICGNNIQPYVALVCQDCGQEL